MKGRERPETSFQTEGAPAGAQSATHAFGLDPRSDGEGGGAGESERALKTGQCRHTVTSGMDGGIGVVLDSVLVWGK